MKEINSEQVKQELKDNKSHFLVSMLDFADQIKNQTHDNQYRIRIDTILSDISSLKKDLVNVNPEITKQIEMIIADLGRLKNETQYTTVIGGTRKIIDYHKVGIEYLKKRIHCDANNLVRRIYLILGIPIEKQKIEKFKGE